MKDLLIIGAGPAGLSAAVYAYRAGLDVQIVESNYVPGGQVMTTYEVDNYLGMQGMNGFDMGMKFKEHLDAFNVPIENLTINKIEKTGEGFAAHCDGETIFSKCIIVATGARNRLLEVDGEEEFKGKGVSYCATCDGAFYKGKVAAVVGGSYTAVEDAIYLSAICEKVYLVHRRDKLRAGALLEKRLFACENVEIKWNSTVSNIMGDGAVNGITLKDKLTGESAKLDVGGVFVAVGTTPITELIKELVQLDKNGYAVAGEDCKTTCEGLFVAGDLRTKHLRQIVTAVADGANATTSAWNYIMENS